MELKWLEDFVTLANTGSFSRSARARNITQPAFSRRIRALEHWCGATLVNRDTSPLTLTSAGRRFHETAIEILRRVLQERAELSSRLDGEVPVSFAAPHSLATYYFPRLLERIEQSVGEVRIRLAADDLHNCADSLAHGGCDLLIAFHCDSLPVVPDTKRFRCLKVAQDRLVPVSAPAANGTAAYRLPRDGDVPAPVLSYASHSYLGRAIAHLLAGRRAVFRKVVYENALADALRVMALSHRGIAWLPEQCVAQELETRRLVLAGGPQWQIPLEIRIHRSVTNRNPVAERVWQALAAAQVPLHTA